MEINYFLLALKSFCFSSLDKLSYPLSEILSRIVSISSCDVVPVELPPVRGVDARLEVFLVLSRL